MMCNDEPVFVNCAESVVLNHGEVNQGSGYESWCALLSQWLSIMVCYTDPIVVNHSVLC